VQSAGAAGKLLITGNTELPDSSSDVDSKSTWYFADIKKVWRKFNIDLMPKV